MNPVHPGARGVVITGGSCHKYNFCRDKGFVFCDKIMLVVTKYFCCDKPVATSILLL